MTFKSYVLPVALTLLFTNNILADERFRGEIRSTLVEESGDVYTLFFGSESFQGQQTLYFRQERGQSMSLSKNSFGADKPKNGKYFAKLLLSSKDNEKFSGQLRLYENTLVKSSKGLAQFMPKGITMQGFEGQLYTNNDFRFVEEGEANLYLNLKVDRVFSLEDIKRRLLKKQ